METAAVAVFRPATDNLTISLPAGSQHSEGQLELGSDAEFRIPKQLMRDTDEPGKTS